MASADIVLERGFNFQLSENDRLGYVRIGYQQIQMQTKHRPNGKAKVSEVLAHNYFFIKNLFLF